MANEITGQQTVQVIQGGQTIQLTKQISASKSGVNMDSHTENYTSTAAKVSISAAVKAEGAGLFALINPSNTETLFISLDNNATYPCQCLPSEAFGPVRLSVAATVDPNIFVKSANNAVGGARVLFTGI